jgi:chloramphenicol phosphotransferase-like protein
MVFGVDNRVVFLNDGRPMLAITYGAVGRRMMAGFHRATAELVRAGNSVVIDEMLLDGPVRDDWLEVLAPWRPLLVGVFCADDVLERRERDPASVAPAAEPPAAGSAVGCGRGAVTGGTRWPGGSGRRWSGSRGPCGAGRSAACR